MATKKPTCSEPDCTNSVGARGLCWTHYKRLRREGRLAPMRVKGRTCTVDGCNEPHEALGYCNRHYLTYKRTGDPLPKHEWDLAGRFLDVGWDVTDSGCWEWRGTRAVAGYGRISASMWGLRDRSTHRLSYELFYGPIPDGLLIRHKCDNPPCVNPDHLEPGTQQDNMDDMVARGRHWLHGRAHCKHGHDLTAPGALLDNGGRRRCRLCVQRQNRSRSTSKE